ncbi:MAG: RNA-binding protein [Gemmataceae bacterium]|nr:RNA-binding protein [Gemmataceae bacterium]
MAKNIYVGNLTWSTTQEDLTTIFSQHGTVTRSQIIMDRETGRSRGFGFVEMANDQEALKAIEAINGLPHQGRNLTVNEARPREERGPRTGGSGGGYGGGGGGYGGGGGGGGGRSGGRSGGSGGRGGYSGGGGGGGDRY